MTQETQVAEPKTKASKKVEESETYIKEVTIKVRPRFTTLPHELYDETVMKIGAYGLGGRTAYRCLEDDELERYSKEVIGLSPNDPRFGDMVDNFFKDFEIQIPTRDGLKLEIPIKIVDKKEVIDIDFKGGAYLSDVMRYRHAINYPKTAVTEEDRAGIELGTHIFYVEDKGQEKAKKIKQLAIKREANEKYSLLIAEKKYDVINWILEIGKRGVYNGIEHKVPDSLEGIAVVESLTKREKELALDEMKDINFQSFLDIVNDEFLAQKSLLYRLVEVGLITLEGNTYFNSNDIMGEEKEAVAYLKNPAKSKEVAILIQKLKAAR